MDIDSPMLENIKSIIVYFGVFMLFLTATVLRKKPSDDDEMEGTPGGNSNNSKSNNYNSNICDEHDAFIVTKKDPTLIYSKRSIEILLSFNTDIHLTIATYLHTNDIISLSVSCITLYEELSDDLIWEQLWILRYSNIWTDFHDIRLLREIHWDPMCNWGPPQSGWFVFYLEFEYCWANWLFAGCNNKDLCYAVLYGEVYNVTEFVPQHPGSSETLLEQCGGDATQTFIDISHSRVANQMTKRYKVGVAAYVAPHEDTNQIISLVVNHQNINDVTSDKVGSVIAKKMLMETYESTVQTMHEYAARASLKSQELFDTMDKSMSNSSASSSSSSSTAVSYSTHSNDSLSITNSIGIGIGNNSDENEHIRHKSDTDINTIQKVYQLYQLCVGLIVAAFKSGNDLMFVIDEDEDEHSFVDFIEGIDSATELYESTKAKLERNHGRELNTPEPGQMGPTDTHPDGTDIFDENSNNINHSNNINNIRKPKEYSPPKQAKQKCHLNPTLFNSSINMRHHAIYCLEIEKLAILNYLSNNIKWCKKVNRRQKKIINITGHASCLAAGAAGVGAGHGVEGVDADGGNGNDNNNDNNNGNGNNNGNVFGNHLGEDGEVGEFIWNENGFPIPNPNHNPNPNPNPNQVAPPPPEHLRVTTGNNLLRFLGQEGLHCGQPRLFYDPLSQEWTVWWSCCALGEVIDQKVIQQEIEKLPIISSSSKRLSIYMKNAYRSYMKQIMRGSGGDYNDYGDGYYDGDGGNGGDGWDSQSETSSRSRSGSSSLGIGTDTGDGDGVSGENSHNPLSVVDVDMNAHDLNTSTTSSSSNRSNRSRSSSSSSSSSNTHTNTNSRRNSNSNKTNNTNNNNNNNSNSNPNSNNNTIGSGLRSLQRMLDDDEDELDDDELVFAELLCEVVINRDSSHSTDCTDSGGSGDSGSTDSSGSGDSGSTDSGGSRYSVDIYERMEDRLKHVC